MKKVNLGGKTVEYYDSIEEMPIKNFHAFNKMMLIDAGVGSDLNDILDHVGKIEKYVGSGDKKNALRKVDNLRQSLILVSEGTNIRHLSFMALIKSINGKVVYDVSDDALKARLDEFTTAKTGLFHSLIEAVKKNWISK